MLRQPDQRIWPPGSFLARLPGAAREELLRIGTVVTYPPAHVLIREGDTGDTVHLLIDALVKVTAFVENGSRTLLAIRANGDIVGEMAALDGSPRSATVTTCRQSVTCVVRGPVFTAHLDRHPATARVLSRVTIDRLRFANRRRLDFAGYEADVCLARILVELADRYGERCGNGMRIGVPITQAELGELIGIRERTVQKAMHDLCLRGLVLRGHRRVVLTDLDALTAFADLKS
ncbi:Crp/Fnr family transcriptional regulator [Planomonospora parontospora]|uniref:Crp/Fnr family transcriptional regulator n=1 Tax=Planomonospora parontospora TaxID=58119 RepID=UPI0019ABC796|nr:Crp/Fnr family transcriptional regulator [Planomonospora parontospora]GGL27930.1 Crp/Fnr family transcriptional regulator [Planomonospora parontospora subsp. antibiotica]GII16462.1 Crp/Fnr family transcriptional regulator [Planomonospora parontospora subsp. antibiotica]